MDQQNIVNDFARTGHFKNIPPRKVFSLANLFSFYKLHLDPSLDETLFT